MMQVGRCCRWYIRRCRAFTGREYGTLSNAMSIQAFAFVQATGNGNFQSTFGPFGPAELLAQNRENCFSAALNSVTLSSESIGAFVDETKRPTQQATRHSQSKSLLCAPFLPASLAISQNEWINHATRASNQYERNIRGRNDGSRPNELCHDHRSERRPISHPAIGIVVQRTTPRCHDGRRRRQ